MRPSRAAYMREYRAKRAQLQRDVAVRNAVSAADGAIRATQRIAELEEEVRHLKAELARRPPEIRPFNSRPFTPVPKT